MDVKFSIPIAVAVACKTLWTFCAVAEPVVRVKTVNKIKFRLIMINPPNRRDYVVVDYEVNSLLFVKTKNIPLNQFDHAIRR